SAGVLIVVLDLAPWRWLSSGGFVSFGLLSSLAGAPGSTLFRPVRGGLYSVPLLGVCASGFGGATGRDGKGLPLSFGLDFSFVIVSRTVGRVAVLCLGLVLDSFDQCLFSMVLLLAFPNGNIQEERDGESLKLLKKIVEMEIEDFPSHIIEK
ncbi:hypothetical protein Gogos_012951, partial [Gossypium gossypioides]|nr:hypothetical protein [Gossypium gossypioides]